MDSYRKGFKNKICREIFAQVRFDLMIILHRQLINIHKINNITNNNNVLSCTNDGKSIIIAMLRIVILVTINTIGLHTESCHMALNGLHMLYVQC